MITATLILTLCATGAFVLTLLMNIMPKNPALVALLVLETILVALVFVSFGVREHNAALVVAGIVTFLVKGLIAPVFLNRRIRAYSAYFAPSSYLGIPATLLLLAILTAFSRFVIFSHIATIYLPTTVSLVLASVFAMFFFIANRRGPLSHIIGVLALESNVVLLAVFLGVQHSVGFELAIAFDLIVWIAIATTFLSMIYRQFGTLEGAPMTHLREE